MNTAVQRPRLRSIALTVVTTLLVASVAISLVSSTVQSAEAVEKNPNLIGAAANPFFVYVKAGEWITAAGPPYAGVGGGTGIESYVDPDGNVVIVPGNSFTELAANDGVYQIHYHTTYPHGTWNIRVTDQANGAGTYREGRVWTETYHMTDSQATGNLNHEFWLMDDSGYQYKLDLYGYTGINSTISANSLGLTRGDECTQVYRSAEGSEFEGTDPLRQDCGSPFRLFFEKPSAALPASAFVNGVERWIAPAELLLDELISGTVDFSPHTNAANPGAGTITTVVDSRFQGGYFVEIDADGDGRFGGPNDRRVRVAAKGGGAYSYEFDGLDNQGNPFPACTPMSTRMTFESVGEIHLVQVDVEKRSGIELQKLNGLLADTNQDRVIYWDDTQLASIGQLPTGDPVNGINPPFGPNGTAGVVSGNGVHGWSYALGSWGDNRVIEDWTYTELESAHSDVSTFTSYCPQPDIVIEKRSDFTADSKPGDTIEYSVSATNTGDGAYTVDNPAVILDDISALIDDVDFDDELISADKPGDTDYLAPLISWEGALEPGETVTLTYEVTLKGAGDGDLHNVAWSPEDSAGRETPDCAEDDTRCDEVMSYLPKLTVEKHASTDAFTGPGDTVEYTVIVTNPGPGNFSAANRATMSDDLTDVLASGQIVGTPSADLGDVSITGSTLSWSGVLAAGQSATIAYEVEYTATYENEQSSMLENTACVPDDHVAQGAEPCATVETPGPVLSQWKVVTSGADSVSAGSTVNYTLHFENSGSAPIEINTIDHLDFVLDDASLQITEDPESLLTVVPDGEKLVITGVLPAGETATVKYSVTPNPDGDRTDSVLSNFLTTSGEEPPSDGICVPKDTERPDCTTTPVTSSILLEKRGHGPMGEIPLAGAEFGLTPTGGDSTSVTDESAAGVFLVEELMPGQYTLVETKAPQGYTLLADSIRFHVLPSGAIAADETDTARIESDGRGTWRLIINDVSAFELPLSGGAGSLPWVVGGVFVTGAALGSLAVRARRERHTSAARA